MKDFVSAIDFSSFCLVVVVVVGTHCEKLWWKSFTVHTFWLHIVLVTVILVCWVGVSCMEAGTDDPFVVVADSCVGCSSSDCFTCCLVVGLSL